MTAFDDILTELAALRAKVESQRTTLTLGTYQADGTVLLTDGAEVTPAATLAIVGTGDTVLLAQHNRRAYIVGQASPTTTSASLDSLSDVDTTGATAGNLLTFDGTQWEPGSGPTPALRARSGQAVIGMGGTVLQTESVSFGVTFSSAPRVFLTLTGDAPDATISAESATTTGFTLRMRFPTNDSGSYYINWLAIPDGSLTV